MSLLIVGNKGSLFFKTKKILSEKFLIDFLIIDKNSTLSKNIINIKNKLEKFNFKYIIHLAGETKKESQMKKFNELFLFEI